MPIIGGGSGGGGGSVALLSTTVLGANGSFDITGISGAYSDLILAMVMRSTVGSTIDNIFVQFNGDTTAGNYDWQDISGSGTSAGAVRGSSPTAIIAANVPGATATASYFGAADVIIHGYSGTTRNKTLVSTANFQSGAANAPALFAFVGQWHSNAAINRVTVFGAAALLAGSELRIYGRT